jgi:hypothetical protein
MRKKRWTPVEIALLGTAPDTEIAKRLDVSASAVARKRTQLGIAPRSTQGLTRWGLTEMSMLGRYCDSQVAELTGRPLKEVVAKREMLGIKTGPCSHS